MLVLTGRQLAAFDAYAYGAFVTRLLAHLRRHHAAALAGHPEATWKARVEAGIDRARRHGFSEESSITAFVALMFEISPCFDQYHAAREILANSRVPDGLRMDALIHGLSEEEWSAAGRTSSVGAWGDAPGKVEDV